MARGLSYLHSRDPPVVHGDLHPVCTANSVPFYNLWEFSAALTICLYQGNALIDLHGVPYLCDFGFSRIRHEVSRSHTITLNGGRHRFIAPEVSFAMILRPQESSDIYSFAMLIFTLATGTDPFSHANGLAANKLAEENNRPFIPDSLHGLDLALTRQLKQLLEEMWQHDPSKRLVALSVQKKLKGLIDGYEASHFAELPYDPAPPIARIQLFIAIHVGLRPTQPTVDIDQIVFVYTSLRPQHRHFLIEYLVKNACYMYDILRADSAEHYLEASTTETIQANKSPLQIAPQPIQVNAFTPPLIYIPDMADDRVGGLSKGLGDMSATVNPVRKFTLQ